MSSSFIYNIKANGPFTMLYKKHKSIQIIAAENSVITNGRQRMPTENTMLRYSTNNTIITRHALDYKGHTAEQKFIFNR